MSFKSEAQRRKFQEMLNDKKITQEVYDEWSERTPKKIPERISKPKTLEDLKKISRDKLKKG